MEEIKKKKSNKGLVAIIIILIIALFGSVGYICYDKGVFDSLLNKGKPVEEPKQEEKSIEYKIVYTDDGEYLIANKDGKWKEYDNYKVEQGGTGLSVFGIKEGKLYYSDNKSIKYIDFENNGSIETLYNSNWKPCRNSIYNGKIAGDKLYFTLSTSCHDSKLVSLDINSDTKKVKDVLDYVSDYSIIGDEIYYDVGFHCTDHIFSKYNIKTGKNTKIGNGICNFEVNDNKIVYFKNNNFYSEKKDKFIYSDKSGYYNYDITSSESQKIDSIKLKFTESNANNMLGTIYKGSVYYTEGNKIIKNTNGTNQTLYTYTKELTYDESKIRLNVITVLSDDVALIYWEEYRDSKDSDIEDESVEEGNAVIKDGKLYSIKDARTMLETYNVTMKDGSNRTFSVIDTIDYQLL